MTSLRTECDLSGRRTLPSDLLYGIHTLRALENFPTTGTTVGEFPELVKALAFSQARRRCRARPHSSPDAQSPPSARAARDGALPRRPCPASPEPAPAGHARTAHRPGQHLLRDTRAKDEDDAGQSRAVIASRSAAARLGRHRWQERRPKVVGHKRDLLMHPQRSNSGFVRGSWQVPSHTAATSFRAWQAMAYLER